MGLFSKPKFPKRAQHEWAMYQQGQAMEREAAGFAPGIRAFVADNMDTSDERIRAGRTNNANAWQAEAAARDYDSTRPGISAFARAMSAGKARSKIISAGDNAVEMQALRDRAMISKAGSGIRSGNVRDMAQLTQGQNELVAADMRAKQIKDAGVAGLLGTVVGGAVGAGVRGFQNWNATRGLSDISVTARPIYTNLSNSGLYQV